MSTARCMCWAWHGVSPLPVPGTATDVLALLFLLQEREQQYWAPFRDDRQGVPLTAGAEPRHASMRFVPLVALRAARVHQVARPLCGGQS